MKHNQGVNMFSKEETAMIVLMLEEKKIELMGLINRVPYLSSARQGMIESLDIIADIEKKLDGIS
jgi:hypothetical protein